MKALVFDTGPLISLSLNNLLWILKPLKDKFNGEFLITQGVKRECVDKPLTSKKFKYEAIQILKLIEDGILKVHEGKKTHEKTLKLLNSANSIFKVEDNYVRNVQYAEIEAIVTAMEVKANAVVIDEFITRSLIENPMSVQKRMKRKLHKDIAVDKKHLQSFQKMVKKVTVLRSIELVTIAFELGFFKDFYLDLPDPEETVLEGLLWGVKLNGCSVTADEIKEILRLEKPLLS